MGMCEDGRHKYEVRQYGGRTKTNA